VRNALKDCIDIKFNAKWKECFLLHAGEHVDEVALEENRRVLNGVMLRGAWPGKGGGRGAYHSDLSLKWRKHMVVAPPVWATWCGELASARWAQHGFKNS
jgi:hypothetical protein